MSLSLVSLSFSFFKCWLSFSAFVVWTTSSSILDSFFNQRCFIFIKDTIFFAVFLAQTLNFCKLISYGRDIYFGDDRCVCHRFMIFGSRLFISILGGLATLFFASVMLGHVLFLWRMYICLFVLSLSLTCRRRYCIWTRPLTLDQT